MAKTARAIDKAVLAPVLCGMAKQAGEYRFRGTVDDLCFYKMDGEYYVRLKSSLTGKRFREDKAFEGSRRSCSRLAVGSQLASKAYNMIDEERRVYKLFRFLQRTAMLLLKAGRSSDEVEVMLVDYLVEFGLLPEPVLEDKAAACYLFDEVVFERDYIGLFTEAPV